MHNTECGLASVGLAFLRSQSQAIACFILLLSSLSTQCIPTAQGKVLGEKAAERKLEARHGSPLAWQE